MHRTALLVVALALLGACVGVAGASTEPMADAGLDQTVTVDTAVQLDGTGSDVPDGTIEGYEWTVTAPTGRETTPECADCERTNFTPLVPGRYEVTLEVTAADGTEATDTMYVYVEDAGPEVELSGDRTPGPGEPTTYTADAESPDAELEEIAWAVENEIVAIRGLDGPNDASDLSLAFADGETYRVQVVVRDTNGRTAYDQLYVQPQSGGSGSIDWSDVDTSLDCSDGSYFSANSEECVPEVSTSTPASDPELGESESPDLDPEEILYQSDGYKAVLRAGSRFRDSSYVNNQIGEVGLDGGANAPWNAGYTKRMYQKGVEPVTQFFFGQERKTVSCEMTIGSQLPSACRQRVASLENRGETTNAYSATDSGAYAEYGLSGAERIDGEDPTTLEDGRPVKITIVIQQQKDGVADKVVESTKETIDIAQDSAETVLDTDRSTGTAETTETGSSSSSSTVDSGGLVSSTTGSSESNSAVRSSDDHTTSVSDSSSSARDSRSEMGLVR